MKNPYAGEISDEIRDNVRREMPILDEIKDAELRDGVVEAWATSLWLNGYTSASQMQGSANVNLWIETGATQADHACGVARLAKSVGEGWLKKNPDFPIDLDVLIAGGLLHDVGKTYIYNEGNIQRWKADPGKYGWPAVSEPIYGYYVCKLVGLPEEICAVPAFHCVEGSHFKRNMATTIVHAVDYLYWDCLKLTDLLEPPEPKK